LSLAFSAAISLRVAKDNAKPLPRLGKPKLQGNLWAAYLPRTSRPSHERRGAGLANASPIVVGLPTPGGDRVSAG